MKRRNIIKSLTLLPFAGTLVPVKSLFAAPPAEQSASTGRLPIGPNIFQSIGVEPIINCRGTFTIIGGSVERPEVRAAMEAASGTGPGRPRARPDAGRSGDRIGHRPRLQRGRSASRG